MTGPQEMEAEETLRFHLTPAVSAEKMLENMRSALARGLPEVTLCKPHGMTLSVAGGGPSLEDTYKDLDGYIAAINGSLKFLLEHEIKEGASYACGVMDAGEHIADGLVADPRVRYYVASICDPSVFDKLKDCDVRLWHVTPQTTADPKGLEALLNELRPGKWNAIAGGCTMGLRWINLGYFLGFRKFDLHGLDSSFRNGATHAYPDRADTKDRIEYCDRETRPNFLAQVFDFKNLIEQISQPWHERLEIRVFGDGLLQDEFQRWLAERPPAKPLVCCVKTGDKYGAEYVTRLRDGVKRHLLIDHDFVCFTDQPVDGVNCQPLPADLPGWWAKLGLFKLGRPLIYFDLDVVITGDLSPLVGMDRFGIIKDWWLTGFNSSVMALRGDEQFIWERFSPELMPSFPQGDQQFITRQMPPNTWTFPPAWFPSFKANKCEADAPSGALAVIFHGSPKPHQCDGWVKKAWEK